MTRLFSNRKIGTKIILGFAVVLVILGAIGIKNYRSFGHMAAEFRDYGDQIDELSLVQDINREFARFERYAGEFAPTKQDTSLANAMDVRKKLGELIGKATSNEQGSGYKQDLADIASELDAYGKTFDKIVVMRGEQSKLREDVLDPLGASLTEDLEKLQSLAASDHCADGSRS